jgi:hypothetical protein
MEQYLNSSSYQSENQYIPINTALRPDTITLDNEPFNFIFFKILSISLLRCIRTFDVRLFVVVRRKLIRVPRITRQLYKAGVRT